MKKMQLGILLGVIAGIIDVIPMLLQKLTWDANFSALFLWIISGFFIGKINMKTNSILKGVIVSFLVLVPSTILIGWKEPLSLLPTAIMTLILGGLLGYSIERLGKENEHSRNNKNWNKKPKELVESLTKNILNDKKLFPQLIDILKNGSDVDKGTCADVMKHISADKPDLFLPYIDVLIEYINYKAPRVKWGVSESIGNLAKKYPKKVEKAIPFLLKNSVENKENTTVIRWCVAYALSEIAKNSKNKELINKIQDIAKKEKNNGVKNVYLKALGDIKKNK